MKKLIIFFLLILLFSNNIYSQYKYPKTFIIESDTVIGITHYQLTKINLGISELEELQNKSSLLYNRVGMLESMNSINKSIIFAKDSIISDLNEQVLNYKLGLRDQGYELEFYKEYSKNQKRKNTLLVIGGVTITVGLLSILLFAK